MCVASRYLDQIEVMLKQVKSDLRKLKDKAIYYDRELSKIYHDVEIRKFNACEGFYITKNLQDVLQRRRLVKKEMGRLEQVYNNLIKTADNNFYKIKRSVDKSKKSEESYLENFNVTFSDIEQEVLH
ncbi:hypothetical protein [Rossellomorea marisflavi]|uniref:hypothetical protein n=1 Tax=Rossellomorea marisflavi TaxID=189381 RepID=UPI003F9F77AE